MIGGPNPGISQLTSIYNANNQAIADSLVRIASGKRVRVPSDDFAAFSRASSLQTDITQYTQIRQDIQEAKGFAAYAAEVGNALVEDFNRLKQLKDLYDNAAGDTTKQTSYKAEYDAVVNRIATTRNDARYDDVQVYRAGVPLKIVAISPDGSSTIDIQASAVGDQSSLTDIAAVTVEAIQTQVVNALTYALEMTSFSTLLQRQLNLTDTVISSKEATISAITDIDDVKELSALTMLQVRQEAAVSMLAQANLVQRYAAQLYGGSV